MDGSGGMPKEWSERLWRFLRRRVRSESDAEDILQETLLAFYSRLSLGELIEDGLAWLFRVAWRKTADLYRRSARGAGGAEDPGAGLDGQDLWELADMDAATPEEEAEREEVRREILAALGELPADQREVLLLHEVEGLSFAEIRERTGAPMGTLLSRKRYALQNLRQRLARGKEN